MELSDNGELKILFLCNTLYQVIAAACIRNTFSYAKAEIILTDHSTGHKDLYDRLNKNTLLFDKVYYVETKYLYEYDENLSKIEKLKIMRNKNTIPSMVNIGKNYGMFFCANIEPFSVRLANYIKLTNKRAKLNWYEDGLTAYNDDSIYFTNKRILIKSKIKEWFLHLYDLRYNLESYYVFKPDKMEWKPYAKIKKIESMCDKTARDLSTIFEFDKCQDKYSEKYIFFEDGQQDWAKGNDIALMEEIAKIVGKENILIKIHPRNTENRFKKRGFKTNTDLSMPWEIIAANINIKDKVLLTMYSQSVLTPDILLGLRGKVISLARLSRDYNQDGHKLFEYMERQYFIKDQENYKVPQTMSEFKQLVL